MNSRLKSPPNSPNSKFPTTLILLTVLIPSLLGLLSACGEETPPTFQSVPTATPQPVTPTPSPTLPTATVAPTTKSPKTPQLHEFNPPLGKFKISLPGQPKSDPSSMIASQTGGTNLQNYVTTQREDGLLIWVSYLDYSDDYLTQNSPDQILNAQHQALLKTEGVTFKSEKDLKLDQTYPGKEYQYSASGFGFFLQRFYLVNNRLYSMAAVGIYGITPTYTYTIFDSFKLTD
jgi:hypothetical protein